MLCAELERLEAEFDEIVSALENPQLSEQEREALQAAYTRMICSTKDHQTYGHDGRPCFEE